MLEYFSQKQVDISAYRDKLDKDSITIDKTNRTFLTLILNILDYLSSEEPKKLDELCEYNVLTMREEFESVIYGDAVHEKAQATLLTFFMRIAKEIDIKHYSIENEHLEQLFSMMTSKDYKFPSYVKGQREFALEKMPANITRMLHLR